MKQQLDAIDRAIINRLQDGLEICDEPFAAPAAAIGIEESGKHRGRVKRREAEKVDRPVLAHQRDGVKVADDAVVLESPAQARDQPAAGSGESKRRAEASLVRVTSQHTWFAPAASRLRCSDGARSPLAERTDSRTSARRAQARSSRPPRSATGCRSRRTPTPCAGCIRSSCCSSRRTQAGG